MCDFFKKVWCKIMFLKIARELNFFVVFKESIESKCDFFRKKILFIIRFFLRKIQLKVQVFGKKFLRLSFFKSENNWKPDKPKKIEFKIINHSRFFQFKFWQVVWILGPIWQFVKFRIQALALWNYLYRNLIF